jgi:sec-independent protein translocase protein TatC
MAFFEHFGELRTRLAWAFGVVLVGALGLYNWGWDIYEWMMRPVLVHLGEQSSIATSPFELFTMRFKVALFASLVVTSPVWIYQIMAFFLPALKPKERKWFVPIFIAMIVFFIGGVAFCYLFVLEPGFGWLLTQGNVSGGASIVEMLPKAQEFFRGVTLFLLGFGLGFQTPIIVFGLVLLGIVPYDTLRANWRTAYVIIMVVASVATPDWSWVTMLSLFGAMLALYEGALLAARIVLRKRIAESRSA